MRATTANHATLDDVTSLVSTGEAADAVGVSRNTLERWARVGLVTPASRTAGKHYRWDIDDLQRQLRELNERPSGTD